MELPAIVIILSANQEIGIRDLALNNLILNLDYWNKISISLLKRSIINITKSKVYKSKAIEWKIIIIYRAVHISRMRS